MGKGRSTAGTSLVFFTRIITQRVHFLEYDLFIIPQCVSAAEICPYYGLFSAEHYVNLKQEKKFPKVTEWGEKLDESLFM